MAKTPMFAVIVVLTLALGIGANSAFSAAEIFEQTVDQEYAVNPDATLSIQNTDGSIRVYAGVDPEISIQAIKKAYSSDRLNSIIVDVKATPKGVAIETIIPPTKNKLSLEDRSGTVDYIITVPATSRIKRLDLVNGEVLVEGLRGGGATAHVVNGWLVARNCFGDLDLALSSGRMEVTYDWWEDAKFSVKLSSPDGDIRAIIPSDASASISAQTETGRIMNKLVPKEEEPSESVQRLNFTTGPAPQTVFEISSVSGDIRIDKTIDLL